MTHDANDSYTILSSDDVQNNQGPKVSPEGPAPIIWGVNWKVPVTMLTLFFSGVLISVGHHYFNSALSGNAVRTVDDGASEYVTQIWILRYGTAFAFLSKTLLASSVAVAYKQHMWVNLRTRENSISTINSIFAATYDFLAFSSPRLAVRATSSALIALVMWSLPLAAVITPSTLLVVPANRTITSLQVAPELNLNDSELYTFAGLGSGASPLVTRITTAAASGMNVLSMPAAVPNTTYKQEFHGPSLKCDAATGHYLQNITNIYTTGQKLLGKIKYLSFTLPEYDRSQHIQSPWNRVDGAHNATTYITQCVTDSKPCNSYREGPALMANLSGESIVCFMRNTTFKAHFAALGDTQTITSYTFDWSNRVTDPVSTAVSGALSAILNGVISVEEFATAVGKRSNNVTGAQLATYRTRIMETALIGLIPTDHRPTATGLEVESSVAGLPQEDKLLAQNRTLADMIEELSRNQTLSLLSSRRLWSNSVSVEGSRNFFYTKYEYHMRNLLLAYGLSIAASAVCVFFGLRALWMNGVSHESSFFSIVATTRSAFLDQLTLGHSLGTESPSESILKTKLRFGVLNGSIEGEHDTSNKLVRAGFGSEMEVNSFKKGQVIY